MAFATSVANNSTSPIAPVPQLPCVALSVVPPPELIKTQAELDASDCNVAVSDFKGKIRDAITKLYNGVYKSSLKEFTNALQHMNMAPESRMFLQNRIMKAVMTDADITKANGTISYTSKAYHDVLFDTLMECKKRTGAMYRNNTKHPLRTRPDRKITAHPYKMKNTSSAETSVPNMPLHTHLSSNEPVVSNLSQGITVNTLPSLQPSTRSVNIDDSFFNQRISNLFYMSKITHELAQKYESERVEMSPDQKQQFQQIIDAHWKFMRTTFE